MQYPLYDLHIHTNLSACSTDPGQTLEAIVAFAAANHIPAVGIANHVWDREVPGSSDWYAPQDFEHIQKIRGQIPRDLRGVRLLIGAETEYAGGRIALTRAHRDQLDYVLVPHSHIHMRGLVLPETCVTDREVAEYLIDSFLSLVAQDFSTAVAHPFCPVGRTPENTKAIFDCITDDEFARCFAAARAHGAAIEINGSCMAREWNNPALMAGHERLFAIARDCGVTFTLGSDAHAPGELSCIHLAAQLADRLSIPEDRFLRCL
jgi:histidinol phosphatase-like PHP family hydrolase